MIQVQTGTVVAERPAIGNRPLLRFCPLDEPNRRLRLTRLETGDIGLLAEEELDLTPYIGCIISVVGRPGRNWVYGVNEIRPSIVRAASEPAPIERASARATPFAN